jgi:hypothetical protein
VTTTGAVGYTGSTIINLNGDVTTAGGTIGMTGPVAITTTPTLDSTNSGGTAAGNDITFSNTINGTTDLTLAGGTGGTVTLTGIVGGSTPLTSLTASGASIHVYDNVTASGSTLLFSDPVVLEGDVTFTDTGSGMTFSSSITGATRNLVLSATAGQITVGGAVNVASLSSTSSGASTFSGAITSNANVGITSTANSIDVDAITSTTGSITIQPSSNIISNQLSAGDKMPEGIAVLRGTLTASAGSVSLSATGRTELLSVATLTGDPTGGNLTIVADSLTIGDYETLTVFGDVDFTVTGAASFGDIIATNSLTIASGSNTVFLRETGLVYSSFGELYENPEVALYATAALPSITPDPTYTGAGLPAEILLLDLTQGEFEALLVYSSRLLPYNITVPPAPIPSGSGGGASLPEAVTKYDRSAAESFGLWTTNLFGPRLSWGRGAPLYTHALGSITLPSLVVDKRKEPPVELIEEKEE